MRVFLFLVTAALAAGCGGSPTAPDVFEPSGWQPDEILVETTGASLGQEAPRTALSADGTAGRPDTSRVGRSVIL